MAVGNVIDMHQVEPGIDKGRHAPGGGFDNDAPRRRGLDVARTDGGGRRHDDGGKPLLPYQAFDFAFGHQLAALVGADHALWGVARALIHGGVAGLQGRDGRRIDHPFHPGLQRCAHRGLGALEIVALNLARIACPEAIIGGDMEQVARAFKRRGHRLFIAHVAHHGLAMQLGDVEPVGGGPHDHPYMQAARHQRPRHGRADETGRSGDQRDIRHWRTPFGLRHFANRSTQARPARSLSRA